MRRCLILVLAMLAAAPGVASAANVERDPTSGVVTISDTGDVDSLLLQPFDADQDEILDANGGLSPVAPDCTGDGDRVLCVRGTSYAIDLGEGNDRFDADNILTPISISGGPGNDDIGTGEGPDVLAGGAGNDFMDGEGGQDDFFGEAGDDTFRARDGVAERISCGAGNDEVDNDPTDIIAECERGVDSDADGFSTAVDCNDSNPNISPGDAEIFDNGVDENCDGRDNPNLDADGDGVPRPLDCDDNNRNVRPTVPEIRGNRVDENCDRRALAWADLGATVSNQWAFTPSSSRLLRMVVINAPRGARITFKCSGKSCPTRKTRRVRAKNVLKRVVLHKGFRGKRLRPGASIKVTITAPQTIGRTYTYRIGRDGPVSTITCRAPGARRSRSCG